MAGFFYNLGKSVGTQVRKANWVYQSVAGTEADAVRAEVAVGRDLAQAMARQQEIDRDPAVEGLLGQLQARLTAVLPRRPWQFHFRGVLGAEVNAFALPGGFIYVTRPLLQLCAGDAHELAFVLGHEMGHVVERHAMERLMANSVINTAVGRLTPLGGLARQSVAGLAASLLNQGYSREQELQADQVGAQLAHRAGFDPRAAVRLLARFPAGAGGGASGYFASHPRVEARIQELNRFLAGGLR